MKKIFLTCAEKGAGAHLEFMYSFLSEENNLFVPIGKDTIFFKEYLKYLNPTQTPDGGKIFDGCGYNYYTKEQAETMYHKIKSDKPKDFQILIKWLEKFIYESNEKGFYINGF